MNYAARADSYPLDMGGEQLSVFVFQQSVRMRSGVVMSQAMFRALGIDSDQSPRHLVE